MILSVDTRQDSPNRTITERETVGYDEEPNGTQDAEQFILSRTGRGAGNTEHKRQTFAF
ncbi:MAG: hypothetical protein AABW86_02315 [Candidatus Micrarchaeota archaeon]